MSTSTERLKQLNGKVVDEILELISKSLNLGAGIQISGDSGFGKSNLGEHLFIQNFRRGVPSVYFDPHGDSVRKIHRILLEQSRTQTQKKLIFLKPSDLTTAFGFNPLHTNSDRDEDPVAFEAEIRKRVETTSKIIFSLFGESEFEGRTKLRRYMTLWLTVLARSGMTLADAEFFADPDSPIYRQILQLAPDEKSRNKLAKLTGQKPSEIENEIGSTELRVLPVLDHPVAKMMFSRRENCIDFRWMIENDMSLLVDLSMSGESPDGKEYSHALTAEVQQLICNLMLTQYLETVLSIPVQKRKQRLLFIDELPVFESSAPTLMKACTEIRKFLTKFVFMHQGSTRFPGGHENEFLQAICKMCAASFIFHHSGKDAEFFAQPFAWELYDPLDVKYEHWVDQEFRGDDEIFELISTTEGEVSGETGSESTSTSHQGTESEGSAERRQAGVYEQYATDSRNTTSSMTSASSSQSGWSKQKSSSTTKSQSLKTNVEVRKVLQSVQFSSKDEQEQEVVRYVASQPIGSFLLRIKGVGVAKARAPLTKEGLPNLKKLVDGYVRDFFMKQRENPWFSDANEETENRKVFVQTISNHLQRLIEARSLKVNPAIEESVSPRITGRTDSVEEQDSEKHRTQTTDSIERSNFDPDDYEGDF